MASDEKRIESSTADRVRVTTDKLRWICDPGELTFETTEEVEPIRGIIGQDDAVEALRFGLETFAPGQNVYVRGLAGAGRTALVEHVLTDIQPACALASDYCYVANFAQPECPKLVVLPRGRGYEFRDAIEGLIRFLGRDLGPALTSESLRTRRQFLDERFEDAAGELSKPFEEELAKAGLAMVSIKAGSNVRQAILPLIEGEPAPPERIQQLKANGTLSEEDIAEFAKKISTWGKKLEDLSVRMRAVATEHSDAVRELFRGEMREILGVEAKSIRETFASDSVNEFLDSMIEEILSESAESLDVSEVALRRFRVNVVLGHRADEECPIIVESSPTLTNLLGAVDRRVLAEGVVVSDHLMISAGSLLRADGGYLILEAREVLREPGAWKVLTRTLRSGCFEVVPSELQGMWSTRTLKPEPIPIQVKVILIGDPGLYYALDAQDADFPHLFKVLADFDSTIERSPEGVLAYAGLFARVAADENLPPFDKSAVAALAEHGARIAGNKLRLTTVFGRLVDIAREAAFLTSKTTDVTITGDKVREAIRRGKKRGDLPARKFRQAIADGRVHVRTSGAEIGQVNGLAVIRAGPMVYGFPARITATIGAGNAGAINIEREAQLSGSIHTKGFYILGGLLRHLLQTQHPLAFSASIAFEQSYGGIDGDSASGAEMCCLLSALTGIPLRQDLAMTGAIDQHGRMLPIGGATEKVEGFFDTCADIELTGTQGVILPQANVRDLMLRQDVVAACEAGRFHIYAVDTIHEALEVFTGVEAGVRIGENEFAEGTLLHTAVERAFEFWALASATPQWATEEDGATEAPADDKAASNPESS